MKCVRCEQPLRDGAVFCGGCGAPQPVASIPAVELAIDRATLAHLTIGERGLIRWRVDNRGTQALAAIAIEARLSDDRLPTAELAALAPGQSGELAVAVMPSVAGFHELAGELRVRDGGGAHRFAFASVHVRAFGAGPRVNVVNIDQSHARVVDNSRSAFGGDDGAGLVGAGDWQAVTLAAVAAPAADATTTAAAAAPPAHVEFSVTTETTSYDVSTILAHGDLATVYGGRARTTGAAVAVKIADQSSDNDLLQHEARVLGLLLATPEKPSIHFAPPREQFRTKDGRLGTVFDQLDGYDLTALRDRCRARGEHGLPPRHLVWLLRRALAALGLAHKNGILHGNLEPAHILVRPRDHMLWLVDWCWAVVHPAQSGQSFKALNETFSPPEVKDRGRPTPASDLYALGKCAIHVLGGDPTAKTFPDGIEPRLVRFVKYLCVESQGGRAQDAWEQYLQIDKLREQLWGAHEFVPLDI